jgi:hypothetical protein
MILIVDGKILHNKKKDDAVPVKTLSQRNAESGYQNVTVEIGQSGPMGARSRFGRKHTDAGRLAAVWPTSHFRGNRQSIDPAGIERLQELS